MASLRPLRRHDPPPRRGGPDRHRPVGSRPRPARVGRPAPGRLLPRLPQPPRRPRSTCASRRRTSPRRSWSPQGEPFAIHPGEFALGRTLEAVELPDDIVARIEGKSSLGRLGLIVHATAGFVDPGFKGTLTLEITNLTRVPIKLYAGPADRAAVVHGARRARRAPVRIRGAGLALPGPGGRHRVAATCGSCPPAVLHAADHARRRGGATEPVKTPFYIAGGLLVLFALVVSAVGRAHGDLPADARRAPHRRARCSSRCSWWPRRHRMRLARPHVLTATMTGTGSDEPVQGASWAPRSRARTGEA